MFIFSGSMSERQHVNIPEILKVAAACVRSDGKSDEWDKRAGIPVWHSGRSDLEMSTCRFFIENLVVRHLESDSRVKYSRLNQLEVTFWNF